MLWAWNQPGNSGYNVSYTCRPKTWEEGHMRPSEMLWKQPHSLNPTLGSLPSYSFDLECCPYSFCPWVHSSLARSNCNCEKITTGFIHTPKLCLNKGNLFEIHCRLKKKKISVSQFKFSKSCSSGRGLGLLNLLGNTLQSSAPGAGHKEAGLSRRKTQMVVHP